MLGITVVEATVILDTIKEARDNPGCTEDEFDECIEILEGILEQGEVDALGLRE